MDIVEATFSLNQPLQSWAKLQSRSEGKGLALTLPFPLMSSSQGVEDMSQSLITEWKAG